MSTRAWAARGALAAGVSLSVATTPVPPDLVTDVARRTDSVVLPNAAEVRRTYGASVECDDELADFVQVGFRAEVRAASAEEDTGDTGARTYVQAWFVTEDGEEADGAWISEGVNVEVPPAFVECDSRGCGREVTLVLWASPASEVEVRLRAEATWNSEHIDCFVSVAGW